MFHVSLEPYTDGMLKHKPVISESSFDDRAKPTIHKNMVDNKYSVKIWGKSDSGQDEEKQGKYRSVTVALR